MSRNISDAVREICLGMTDVSEVISRSSPNFRVANKTFAIYQINHHGDGRIALWLNSPPGAQKFYVEENQTFYFVPPYVGPRGWLGLNLDKGLDWQIISQRIHEAYANVAPAKVLAGQPEPVFIEPPSEGIDPAVFDPFQTPELAAVQALIADYCLALPETSHDQRFGAPSFRAGKKTFDPAFLPRQAGIERLGRRRRTGTRRSAISNSPVHGSSWLAESGHTRASPQEIEALILNSYRHFALKRMLLELDTMGIYSE